jgi:hypothetical protein
MPAITNIKRNGKSLLLMGRHVNGTPMMKVAEGAGDLTAQQVIEFLGGAVVALTEQMNRLTNAAADDVLNVEVGPGN